MITIGLTGGIACGKSTVAALLRSKGCPVLDADQVARDVVALGTPGLREVAERFGPSVLHTDGTLNRAQLGEIVMANSADRADLEAITHPRIFAQMDGWLKTQHNNHAPVTAIEAALMIETGSYRRFDSVWVVSCCPATQKKRLIARDGIDSETADRWISSQLPLAEKEALANEVLNNDGEPSVLVSAVNQAWSRLKVD